MLINFQKELKKKTVDGILEKKGGLVGIPKITRIKFYLDVGFSECRREQPAITHDYDLTFGDHASITRSEINQMYEAHALIDLRSSRSNGTLRQNFEEPG